MSNLPLAVSENKTENSSESSTSNSGVSQFLPSLQQTFKSPASNSTPSTSSTNPTGISVSSSNPQAPVKIEQPSYHLSFTCKQCGTRSGHVISKDAYQHGSVVMTCPGCKSKHLMADNLKLFVGGGLIEEVLKKHGSSIKTTVNSSGDIEIVTNQDTTDVDKNATTSQS